PLVVCRRRQPQQVQDRRSQVNLAGNPADAHRLLEQARSRHDERHADVLLVDEERVPEVARMLAECLAVIADDDDQGLLVQPALPQAGQQLTDGSIRVRLGVAVTVDVFAVGEGTRLGVSYGWWPATGR